MRLRLEGTPFCAQFELSDPRAALARQLAPLILQNFDDYDDRLVAFDALSAGTLKLGETAQNQLSVYQPPALKTLKEVAKLCEAALVRSALEHRRLGRHLEYLPQPHFIEPEAEFTVPQCTEANECVVILAPSLEAQELALLAFALEELRRPVVVICREGTLGKLRARIVLADDADAVADALGRACVIVDASLDHAGNAIEFARKGYSVVASGTCGAAEFLCGLHEYDPWNHRTVFSAVTTALGAPAPVVRMPNFREHGAVQTAQSGPLVSIIVRTFNRAQFLPRALDSLQAQTYRDLEILVVNDGGEDVGEIVARYANARYIALPENRGTSGAGNAGLEATRGTYVGFLDDDDVVFPEHVGTLVRALTVSGGSVAHADTISAHFVKRAGGEYDATGYVTFLDGLVEPTDFYVTDAVGPMSVLMKRTVVLAAGGFDERLSHAEDWELFLKLAQHYDFIHVPRITGMYSIRHDGTHMMSDAGAHIADSMQHLMELHPLPHRPVMEAARRDSLQKYRKSGYAMRFPEPALRRE